MGKSLPILILLSFFMAMSAGRSSSAANVIQTENAAAGTSEWQLTTPGRASGVIEGYASATSVNVGGTIALFVNTRESSYTLDIFRMGFYGGLGGRRMLPTVTQVGVAQPACPMDSTTGLVECNWISPYVLTIPSSWVSGIYLVKLTSGTTGTQQYIQFTVRDDRRSSAILMIQGVNTYQAYNVWGGKSLYGTIASRSDTANKAVKVSFNRPYYGDEGNGAADLLGSVQWERNMLFFLEKEGYDVSYATDVDVHDNANALLTHKVVEVVGHSEYWSWAMVDNMQQARDAGVNLFFASGNTAYWQVRYEPSTIDGTPARTMVGYKELLAQDPQRNTQYATTEFRHPPVNRSEDQLLGVRFVTQARPPFCVEDETSWIFTGTGLHNGDCLLNSNGSPFLGYEVDAMGPFSPSNAQRAAHSPATGRLAHFSDMTVYRAASGATVVDIGSIGWSETISPMQQITRNILARMINGSFPDTIPVWPALPTPFASTDVGDVGRPGFVAQADATSFTLNGAGSNDPFAGQDALFYAYQRSHGDGQIVVRLKSCQNFWDNRCGIAIRENLTAGSRSVALLGTPSESSGSVNEGAELRVKSAVGGHQNKVAGSDLKQPNWLKLVRSGNTFTGYLSSDGGTWTVVGSTSLALNSDVFIGAVVQGAQRGVWVTAVFDNVSVVADAGPPPADTTKPVVSMTSPANGATVSGTITVSASASDNVGVSGVQFQLDGVNVGSEDTTSPYVVSLATTAAANGTHTLSAIARDAAGNASTASTTVTIANTIQNGALDRSDWTAVASESSFNENPSKALDGSLSTRYTSGKAQHPGQTFSVSWPVNRTISRIRIDLGSSAGDYPRGCTIAIVDQSGTSTAEPCGVDTQGNVDVSFTPLPASKILVTQSGTAANWWSIAELNAFGPPAGGACASLTLSKTSFYSGISESNWTEHVTAPTSACTWLVSVDQTWIGLNATSTTPLGAASFTGTGTASFTIRVQTNRTGVSRTGHITINGTAYVVKQD